MMKLRFYQEDSIEALFAYFREKTGNPLVVLPTGTGKSLTQAGFIKRVCDQWGAINFLLITHVRELIEQDARAIINHWPDAPIGIWSASLGRKDHEQITVAGIQSIHKYPAKFGKTDVVLIDEAHLVSKNANTMYGRFLAELKRLNPNLVVVGFTATEYRLDSGRLTDGESRIFTDVAYEYNVGEAIKQGFLCSIVSKNGVAKADLSNVHTRAGDFRADELAAANDHAHLIEGSLDEVAAYAHDRKHVLVFSAGIEHGAHVVEAMKRRGWEADLVHGAMSAGMRDSKLSAFASGRTKYLVNAMLLTTGYDFPGIDCILDYQSTKSVGLYYQKVGRGLRNVYARGMPLDTQDERLAAIAAGPKRNCLYLDFGGSVQRHGPIDLIKVKSKREKDEDSVSVAPVKECPECHELVHASVMICPACEYEFPEKAPHDETASDGVVVAATEPPRVLSVDAVSYHTHVKLGKAQTMRVVYSVGLQVYNEWIPIEDERSSVRKHAVRWFWQRGLMCPETVEEGLAMANEGKIPAPATITVVLDGKWWKVIDTGFVQEVAA
jgi:DNA repair protein RadD